MIVERPDQDRHDRERPLLAKHILKPYHLELDRMFRPVHQFVVEQLRTGGRGDPFHVLPIGPHDAQRGLKVFQGQRKVMPAVLMRDPQNQEGVDVGLLGQLSVRPRVNGPAPAEVDVRAEHSPKPLRPAGPLNRQRAGAPAPWKYPWS